MIRKTIKEVYCINNSKGDLKMGGVICAGELLIDFICTDKDVSIINGVNFIKRPGGAPANVAAAIAKMGAQSYFLGCVGNDPFGIFLENTLNKYGINCDMLIKKDDVPTTFAFVSLRGDGERDFYFSRGADVYFSTNDIKYNIIDSANVFHFGSATAFLGGSLLDTYYELLNYGAAKKKIISFDPNYRDFLYKNKISDFIKHCVHFISRTDILKVSEEEAAILAGTEDTESAAKKLCEMGARFTIVTLGAKGALVAHGGNTLLIESEPVRMVDATGAGDAFIGTLVAGIAKKYSAPDEITFEGMRAFVKRGNIAGAVTVQKYGALEAIPTQDEIERIENAAAFI